MTFQFQAIGTVRSCFTDKFGIPRQPGLAPAARAQLELLPPYDDPLALEGLELCSHIWIQFVFHRPPASQWKARVRPPRLGGNKSLGVFATRSPLRPNPIGLSVVKLEGVRQENGKVWLELSGIDLLDGTPVLDIKPYVPYTDAIAEAENRFADEPPALINVEFSPEAETACRGLGPKLEQELETLIQQILQQDPRPQYQQPDPARRYGMELMGLEIGWRYLLEKEQHSILVTDISEK